ncbi:hypothetical protein U1Q18_009008 [Sarracenia purpurea var. burkii]
MFEFGSDRTHPLIHLLQHSAHPLERSSIKAGPIRPVEPKSSTSTYISFSSSVVLLRRAACNTCTEQRDFYAE